MLILIVILIVNNIHSIMETSLQTATDVHTHIHKLLTAHLKSTRQSVWSSSHQIVSTLKILLHQYLQSTNTAQINIQLLYEYVNDQFYANVGQFQILDLKVLDSMGNFHELVVIPVLQFLIKDWNATTGATLLRNMVNQATIDCIQCLCTDPKNVMDQSISNSKFCYKCGRLFHKLCFNIQSQSQQHYECPQCFLTHCLPDRQVLSTIYKSYLPPVSQTQPNTSIICIDWPITRLCQSRSFVELRCVRIGGDYEITWPDTCDIYLDDVVSVRYCPLPETSPLKRRHDHPIVVPIRDLSCSENIKILEQFSGVSAWHLITVSLVRQRNQKQIFEELMQEPGHTIGQTQSKAYLQKLFWKSNSLQMQQVKISNKCQFYRQQIKYPCRSRHCSTHYQPFDLYSFICSSVVAKSSVKRWKCPICGVRAYDIVLDLYLRRVMTQGEIGNGETRFGVGVREGVKGIQEIW